MDVLTCHRERRVVTPDLALGVAGRAPVDAGIVLLAGLDSLEEEQRTTRQKDAVGLKRRIEKSNYIKAFFFFRSMDGVKVFFLIRQRVAIRTLKKKSIVRE